jgi:ABC-2 type transport system ATP-binding protein
MSVSVQQITKIFGTQHAVDEVSFEVPAGQVLGFLGPNGAGKSTTMKIITGFLPPSAGKVSVCGHDVETASLEARRHIGYLPEHNPLYPEMYVREYLDFCGKLYRIPRRAARIADMIELTGLGREQHKRIGALSKGYRQRVGLAQAILHDPDVLILDEPTSALDPNQLEEVRNLIRSLGKNKTLIFSTHIMQEVSAVCDRVIIINKGRIVADDPIETLQRRISGETVITIGFSATIDVALLKKIPGVTAIKALPNHTFQLSSSGQTDIRPRITEIIRQHNLPMVEMHRETLSVEDIFKRLTAHDA